MLRSLVVLRRPGYLQCTLQQARGVPGSRWLCLPPLQGGCSSLPHCSRRWQGSVCVEQGRA